MSRKIAFGGPCRNITTMCRKIAFFWIRAEILLSRDKVSLDSCAGPFLGFVNKYRFLEKYTPLNVRSLHIKWVGWGSTPPGLTVGICENFSTFPIEYDSLILKTHRAASGIGNTDFLSVTDFFAQKGGKPNIFRYFFW